MFSSAEFLSPRVTAGLPAPCPLAAELVVVVPAALVDELVVDFELLPHAASNTPAAASAVSAATARARAAWNLIEPLSCIRCLLVVICLCTGSSLCGGRRAELPHRSARPRARCGAYSAWCEDVLKERERALDREREQRDADRGAEHAREVVARLVRDDVAEAPAEARERRDRRGADHEHRRGSDAGEYSRHRER